MSQLGLGLPHRPALGREDFLASEANRVALEWVERWPDWPQRRLALHGPADSGKTHLAAVWAARSGATSLAGPDLDPAGIRGAIVLEDAARAPEESLVHAMNLMAENGHGLLLVDREPPARWPVKRPDLATRLTTVVAVALGAPDDALFRALIGKLFADRQLRVGDEVVGWLAARLERSHAAARAAVERLDRAALAEGRAVTVPLARTTLDLAA
ncbi:MAG: hypothetical protein FJX46_14685 [Alphaproteobacteria bacterium]|nr:hypothetical protein [Alphaproteobacteria bacterium]